MVGCFFFATLCIVRPMKARARQRGLAALAALGLLLLICAGALLFAWILHRQHRPSLHELTRMSNPPQPYSYTTGSTAPVHTVSVGPVATAAAPQALTTSASTSTITLKFVQPDSNHAQIAHMITTVLPRMHLTHMPFDDSLATNALQLYLEALDYDRSFFMGTDIERFHQQAVHMAESVQEGDVALAFDIFNTFKARVLNRLGYVNHLLETGFDLKTHERYQWKRKTAPWPSNEKEWDDLWRKKIQNEYVARLVAMKLAEESKSAATNAAPPSITNHTTGVAPSRDTSVSNAPPKRATDAQESVLAPDKLIRKRYERFLTVLNDNDAEWVLQSYLSSFLRAYDPHSEYMSASSAEDFDIGMKLSLVGIGALLSTSEDGAAKIERIIPGGPADRDGRLKAGDRIIAVAQNDGEAEDILHLPLYKTVRKIRGEKGTMVTLTIIPAADITGSVTVPVKLQRDEVKLEESAAKGRMEKVTGDDNAVHALGIINLPAFYADLKSKMKDREEYRSSTRDIAQIITDMQSTGAVEGIVLDLRNNGGGALAEAVEMSGLFITHGPIVQVKESRRIQALSDPNPAILYDGPLIVLINRQSASASEILAGALQDYGRAVIIGDSKTHGKGTVQSLVNLDERKPKLGSIKVTTASFHRITGGSTQLQGIRADLLLPSFLETMEVGEEYLPHALSWTRVPSANYRMFRDLQPLIALLRARSQARQKTDGRFTVHHNLMEKLATQQATQDIALNLEERLGLARSEKELQEMQKEMEDEEEEADAAHPKPGDKNDLVLSETLRILCDMISLSANEKARQPLVQ